MPRRQSVSRRSRRQLAQFARQLTTYTAPDATVEGPVFVSWWLALGGLFQRLGLLNGPPPRPPRRRAPADLDVVPCLEIRATTGPRAPIRDVVTHALDARRP